MAFWVGYTTKTYVPLTGAGGKVLLICHLLMLAGGFFIPFYMGGFWRREEVHRQAPRVTWLEAGFIKLLGPTTPQDSNPYQFAWSPHLGTQNGPQLTPRMEVYRADLQPRQQSTTHPAPSIHFTIEVPLPDCQTKISQLESFWVVRYDLPSHRAQGVSIAMEAPIHFQKSIHSQRPLAGWSVRGDLRLRQARPLTGGHNLHNTSRTAAAPSWTSLLSLPGVFAAHNLSTDFHPRIQQPLERAPLLASEGGEVVSNFRSLLLTDSDPGASQEAFGVGLDPAEWDSLLADAAGIAPIPPDAPPGWKTPPSAGPCSFLFNSTIDLPTALVEYQPSVFESLKWGWVQYFPFAYALHWVLWQVRGVLTKTGLIPTRVLVPD